MSQIAYVNGVYLPLRRASVSVSDRGFQFADSIYEVWAVRGGSVCDEAEHMARLRRSLGELRIKAPMADSALRAIIGETMRRNRVHDGIVYMQISRGVAARDHFFPSPSVKATLVVTAKNLDARTIAARAAVGVKVVSAPETRWARRDIKSTNLLANVLARQQAREAGAFEAWFVDQEGYVTEGTSSNAWIVDANGVLRTRALSHDLLHGVTRAALLQIVRRLGRAVEERSFTIEDALGAREAFISAASNPAMPVIALDGRPIGDGRPGPVSCTLRDAYLGMKSSQ
ncbi:MAG: D-amino-acid transaminase [Terricaulis sp.]